MISLKKLLPVVLLTLLMGVGAYAVAYQFNDGKITQSVMGFVFIGMSFPSLIIGGVMRIFRPDLQRYFAITAITCIAIGLFLLIT
ncbi:MAG: hypothetical protein RIR11_3345 [Bacteroidota bacterium]|jgi:hypothetical protein